MVALSGAVTVIILNAKNFWIGKELQGSINQDSIKILALQLTAKLHELLMLASLGNILYAFVLELTVLGNGMPLGALTAGSEFSKVSYLWSKGFLATYITSFDKKFSFILLAIVCTLLGVLVGPSSATAMAPSLDDWPMDQLKLSLNVTENLLWPSELKGKNPLHPACTDGVQSCPEGNIWTTLADNMLSYWDHTTMGGIKAMPEYVLVPSSNTLRTIHVRFRGPVSLYQPPLTAATIQSTAMANMVTSLRLLWYRSDQEACAHQKHTCSFKDIKWSIDTLQPVTYTACNRVRNDEEYWAFPTMTTLDGEPTTANMPRSSLVPNNSTLPLFQWVDLVGHDFDKASVGVIIRLPDQDDNNNSALYACSIDAQWANSTTETTFLGSPYVVDGSPEYFFQPDWAGSSYNGRRVKIRPSWAQEIDSVMVNTNSSGMAFNTLYRAGAIPSTEDAASKIEACLAVLIATSMGQIGAEASADLGQILVNSPALEWRDLQNTKPTTLGTTIALRVTIKGYAYGLFPASGFAVGRFLSVLTLTAYCAMVMVYFGFHVARRPPFVNAWSNILEMISLALHTSIDNSREAGGASDIASLCTVVKFMEKQSKVEMVRNSYSAAKLRYSSLQIGEVYS